MANLRIRLFGKLSIRYDDRPLKGLESGKVQELLCYLLVHRDRPHPREVLAGLLWENATTSQSKKYLRQALWQLQNDLQEEIREEAHPLLLVEPDWIRINPEADLFLDIAEFEKAYKCAHGLRGWQLNADQLHGLKHAEALYSDDMLLGWYQDWCLYERERLQNMCLSILDKLMAYCEAHGEYETGLGYGARILTFDRARERTHRRLMRLHYFAGDRTAALRQYEGCVRALKEELNVDPAARTRDLYTLLIHDEPLSTHAEEGNIIPSMDHLDGCLPSVMGHLKELHWILADVQRHVRRDIESIERILKS